MKHPQQTDRRHPARRHPPHPGPPARRTVLRAAHQPAHHGRRRRSVRPGIHWRGRILHRRVARTDPHRGSTNHRRPSAAARRGHRHPNRPGPAARQGRPGRRRRRRGRHRTLLRHHPHPADQAALRDHRRTHPGPGLRLRHPGLRAHQTRPGHARRPRPQRRHRRGQRLLRRRHLLPPAVAEEPGRRIAAHPVHRTRIRCRRRLPLRRPRVGARPCQRRPRRLRPPPPGLPGRRLDRRTHRTGPPGITDGDLPRRQRNHRVGRRCRCLQDSPHAAGRHHHQPGPRTVRRVDRRRHRRHPDHPGNRGPAGTRDTVTTDR